MEATLPAQRRKPSIWKKFWSEPGFAILTLILALAILAFIVLPVFAVLLKSFGFGTGTITLEHYKEFFASSTYLTALKNSVLSSVVSTIVVTILGIIVSLYVT